jgi:hypothetical protein
MFVSSSIQHNCPSMLNNRTLRQTYRTTLGIRFHMCVEKLLTFVHFDPGRWSNATFVFSYLPHTCSYCGEGQRQRLPVIFCHRTTKDIILLFIDSQNVTTCTCSLSMQFAANAKFCSSGGVKADWVTPLLGIWWSQQIARDNMVAMSTRYKRMDPNM